MPRYVVRLTEAERQRLEDVLSKGRHAAATATRARILLKADEGGTGPGWGDDEIVRALDTSLSTVHRVRQEFVESGLDAAPQAGRRPGGPADRAGRWPGPGGPDPLDAETAGATAGGTGNRAFGERRVRAGHA
jgi:hypothetical protein